MVDGLPFEMKQPGFTAKTEAAMRKSRDIANGKTPAKSYLL